MRRGGVKLAHSFNFRRRMSSPSPSRPPPHSRLLLLVALIIIGITGERSRMHRTGS